MGLYDAKLHYWICRSAYGRGGFSYGFGKGLGDKCVGDSGIGIFAIFEDSGPGGYRNSVGIAISNVCDFLISGEGGFIQF